MGLALLRRLAPTSNFGLIISKLVENRSLGQTSHLDSQIEQTSGVIHRRSLCSWNALQSPAESPDKATGSVKARSAKTHKVESNEVELKSLDSKSRRDPPGSRQSSAARARGPRKSRSESLGEAEDYTMEQKSSMVEPRTTSGELTGEVEKPSAYVTSDFVDYRAMQLVFLGTSSSIPTWNRSTSCIALRLGLLCRIGLKEFQSKNPIHIYGPQGLRQWIRSTLNASHARVHPKYSVHEMILKKKPSKMDSWNLVEEKHEDELPGKDVGRSSDGLWHIYKDEKYLVKASFLRHTIPCWGYVVEEHARRGRFNVERALQAGVKPGRYFRMLETGDSVTLASGKVVSPSDVLGPPRRGRKVVILGDTCDSKLMVAAAKEADVVVHEATVLEQDASEAYQRGHSTAEMAGEFARTISAGTLVLTHFSRKLDGALFVDEKSHVRTTMKDLVLAAQQAFGNDSVVAAEDLMAITIQLADKPPVQLVNK